MTTYSMSEGTQSILISVDGIKARILLKLRLTKSELSKFASRRAGWTHPSNVPKRDAREFRALIFKCDICLRLSLYIALINTMLVSKDTST